MMGSLVLLAQLVERLKWYSNTSKALWCTLEACDFEKVKDTVQTCGEPQMGSKPSWDTESLYSIVPECTCYADVIRRVGLTLRAGNYKTVQKHINRLNIDISHFTGQSWVGTREYLPVKVIPLEEILVEGSSYGTSNLRLRLIREGVLTAECSNCHLTEWLDSPIALELDHVNGVSNDHRLENLRLLCPNCHALTPTWRGRNRKTSVR